MKKMLFGPPGHYEEVLAHDDGSGGATTLSVEMYSSRLAADLTAAAT